MDRLDVIVAYDEKPSIGPAERAEPAVNGESLVERLQCVEGSAVSYAGLAEEQLLVALREQQDASVRIKVLGCICGDDVCSSASVEVVRTASDVVWRTIRASSGPADLYAGIGPFRFDRAQYEKRSRGQFAPKFRFDPSGPTGPKQRTRALAFAPGSSTRRRPVATSWC